jgi:hypothetical protein
MTDLSDFIESIKAAATPSWLPWWFWYVYAGLFHAGLIWAWAQ